MGTYLSSVRWLAHMSVMRPVSIITHVMKQCRHIVHIILRCWRIEERRVMQYFFMGHTDLTFIASKLLVYCTDTTGRTGSRRIAPRSSYLNQFG